MWGRQPVGPFLPLRSAHADSGRVLLRAIPPPAPILPADGSSAPHSGSAFGLHICAIPGSTFARLLPAGVFRQSVTSAATVRSR